MSKTRLAMCKIIGYNTNQDRGVEQRQLAGPITLRSAVRVRPPQQVFHNLIIDILLNPLYTIDKIINRGFNG